ncbi:WG repeat-containing protein [Kaistella flava (ex Peng et al. 2021)]|uniref:WG repeat-containing protein n=1 Tax=Kaistella flava (ex Peng et al. 2021) TaxID=2038776 RepID=A0A7M2YCE4_9FLAO|nr:WG repeat-containing protein [Kaistella flava (ex Peng et al. 2021)]QOW11304.1 WG repeat-containing protein [Kaistella flava (ex Peng et al. 2021)]
MIKNILTLFLLSFSMVVFAQKKPINKKVTVKKIVVKKTIAPSINSDLIKINDSIPALIPYKKNGKSGFINQKGKVIIQPIYSNVGFFTEDCNLLHSPNIKVQKFGSKDYSSVRLDGEDYRIDMTGKRVYQFKDEDLGICPPQFKAQLFHAYILNKAYGIIEDSKFENPGDYRQFTIYPQFEYLHILEGDDLKNPMIIAVRNDKFGIIDVNSNIIIPFEYEDIKRNYSWKLGRLFEVTKDGKNYYYIDIDNKEY